MTTAYKLEAFAWLPIEKWTHENLIERFLGPDGKSYCKVCDGRVATREREEHALAHREEWEQIKSRSLREIKIRVSADLDEHGNPIIESVEELDFYKEPCKACGEKIPRSGKRGRPPTLCTACKEKEVA